MGVPEVIDDSTDKAVSQGYLVNPLYYAVNVAPGPNVTPTRATQTLPVAQNSSQLEQNAGSPRRPPPAAPRNRIGRPGPPPAASFRTPQRPNSSGIHVSPAIAALLQAHEASAVGVHTMELASSPSSLSSQPMRTSFPWSAAGTAASIAPAPQQRQRGPLSPVMVVKLPDGSSALAVPPEAADQYSDQTLQQATALDEASRSSSAAAARAAARGDASGAGGQWQDPITAAYAALSPEAHASVAIALTSADNIEDLQTMGYELSGDGWLTLPLLDSERAQADAAAAGAAAAPGQAAPQRQRVFLPHYLQAQEQALQRTRRQAVSARPRTLLLSAAKMARTVRFFAMFQISMAVLELLTGQFIGMLSFLAIGGYVGARYGRPSGLYVYLLYCAYSLGMCIWSYAQWASYANSSDSTIASVFASTSARLGLVLVVASTLASVASGIACIFLLRTLKQLRALGHDAGINRPRTGQFPMLQQRAPRSRQPQVAAGLSGVVVAPSSASAHLDWQLRPGQALSIAGHLQRNNQSAANGQQPQPMNHDARPAGNVWGALLQVRDPETGAIAVTSGVDGMAGVPRASLQNPTSGHPRRAGWLADAQQAPHMPAGTSESVPPPPTTTEPAQQRPFLPLVPHRDQLQVPQQQAQAVAQQPTYGYPGSARNGHRPELEMQFLPTMGAVGAASTLAGLVSGSLTFGTWSPRAPAGAHSDGRSNGGGHRMGALEVAADGDGEGHQGQGNRSPTGRSRSPPAGSRPATASSAS